MRLVIGRYKMARLTGVYIGGESRLNHLGSLRDAPLVSTVESQPLQLVTEWIVEDAGKGPWAVAPQKVKKEASSASTAPLMSERRFGSPGYGLWGTGVVISCFGESGHVAGGGSLPPSWSLSTIRETAASIAELRIVSFASSADISSSIFSHLAWKLKIHAAHKSSPK